MKKTTILWILFSITISLTIIDLVLNWFLTPLIPWANIPVETVIEFLQLIVSIAIGVVALPVICLTKPTTIISYSLILILGIIDILLNIISLVPALNLVNIKGYILSPIIEFTTIVLTMIITFLNLTSGCKTIKLK